MECGRCINAQAFFLILIPRKVLKDCIMYTRQKRPANKISISKFAFWLTFRLTYWVKCHDEAVPSIFLCFLEAYRIAILKIAFLSAGTLQDPNITRHMSFPYFPLVNIKRLGSFLYNDNYHGNKNKDNEFYVWWAKNYRGWSAWTEKVSFSSWDNCMFNWSENIAGGNPCSGLYTWCDESRDQPQH